jgi:hypothetical protein
MMNAHRTLLACALGAALLTGCDLREPERLAPAVAPAGQHAAPAQAAPAAAPADDAKREAGQRWLAERILASASPAQPVALQPDARYLLHPGEDASATMQVNVSGIASLVLEPVIESFQGNADCTGNPDAGVVDLTWSLDGGKANVVRVDRDYAGRIAVDTRGAAVLALDVAKGNGVIWCDWFAIGVSDVTPAGGD